MEFSIYRANVFRAAFGLVYINEQIMARQNFQTSPLKTGNMFVVVRRTSRFRVFVYRRADKRERILTCRCLINASHNRYSGRPSSSPASKINARRRRPVSRNERCRNRSVRERQAGNNKSPQTVLFTSFFTRQSNFLWHRRVSSDLTLRGTFRLAFSISFKN